MDLTELRSLFPITQRYTYLNHAGIGPCPLPVTNAIAETAALLGAQPIDPILEDLLGVAEDVKTLTAHLINAERSDEIVQVPGTAAGINIAAQGLPLDTRDNVLLLAGDYPAVVYPWMNAAPRGVEIKTVPTPGGGLDLDLLASSIDSRTRAVCVSTAMFASGYRNDVVALGRLCRERNLFFVVDAIQTLGCLPIDVQASNVDILAAGSHKWLLAGTGTGLLYVRHALLRDMRLGPPVGALSVMEPMEYDQIRFSLADTSERFVTSAWPFIAHAAMRASLRVLREVGMDHIQEHVLRLTRVAAEDLRARGYGIISNMDDTHRSGLLIVRVPDPHAAHQRLTAAGVITSVRGGGIRVSPHLYNTEEEVLRVGEVLGDA